MGMTSAIAGTLAGDKSAAAANTDRQQAATAVSKEQAKARLEAVKEAQRNCGSDAGYWSYQGEISYWTCVVDLVDAASLVGPDSLPDVEAPKGAGVLMDMCSDLERFGQAVRNKALAIAAQTNQSHDGSTILGVGDIKNPELPEGVRRKGMEISGDEIETLSAPMMDLLNRMRDEGAEADKLMAVLMIVTGQVMAQENVVLDPKQSVEQAISPLVFGYQQVQMAVAGGAH